MNLSLKRTTAASLAFSEIFLCAPALWAQSLPPPNHGLVHVTVKDENGAAVSNAPVYVYCGRKLHSIFATQGPGAVTFDMPSGDYRISTAFNEQKVDSIGRYSSYEAGVRVGPDDVYLILTLHPLDDAVTYLSDLSPSALRKMGLDSQLSN